MSPGQTFEGETTLSNETEPKALNRRGFLAAGAATTVAAAAVVIPEQVAAQATTRETRQERDRARYQANSKHIQDFYRTNRY